MSVRVVSSEAFVHALDAASSIALAAYLVPPKSPVVQALERAAERGAQVSVTLEGTPYERAGSNAMAAENRALAAELGRHGVSVRLTSAGAEPLHLKAAVVDGTAYLDDRNWTSHGPDTIVATGDAGDVAAVLSALAGNPVSHGSLATEKSAALALEVRTIYAAAGDRIDVESESFGTSAVSAALRCRASQGTHVRLIVGERELRSANSRERGALQRLASAGVEVRAANDDEKLCVAGTQAWVGSANATFASAARPSIDWGLQTDTPSVVAALEGAFERDWRTASPVTAAA